jgi:hypothetical protein
MDKHGAVNGQLPQLPRLEFILLGLLVRIGCASRADSAAKFVYHSFPDKLGALFSTLFIGGAKDHAVA